MGNFFGTDGIRGVFNKELTSETAFKLGCCFFEKKIVVGRDTRMSGDLLLHSFSLGAMLNGCRIFNADILPTPAISFLVKNMGFDYGVMITASHNPPEYNGIKIFDKNGFKISRDEEISLEGKLTKSASFKFKSYGSFVSKRGLIQKYEKHILTNSKSLEGMSVLLDCSNGASFKIAPKLFRKLGAKVCKVSCFNSGEKINSNCGAIYIQNLKSKLKECGCDIALAFDGDGDRVMGLCKTGEVIDGDRALLMLAKYLKTENTHGINEVVATHMSNISLEKELKNIGINLTRVDVGDKNITKCLYDKDLPLGAEQSGHIILKHFLPTGDGVMAGIKICEILKYRKDIFENVMETKFSPQRVESVHALNVKEIVESAEFKTLVLKERKKLGDLGRIYVRASGTEPKIRILVESQNEVDLNKTIKELTEYIKTRK